MKIREIKESEIHEINRGHVIISPDRILTDNKRTINDALTQLSKAYNISMVDAAFALENALKRLSGGSSPARYE